MDYLVSTVLGSGEAGIGQGLGAAVQFRNPSAILADAKHLYIADTGNHR
jgi:hypothetical protein